MYESKHHGDAQGDDETSKRTSLKRLLVRRVWLLFGPVETRSGKDLTVPRRVQRVRIRFPTVTRSPASIGTAAPAPHPRLTHQHEVDMAELTDA